VNWLVDEPEVGTPVTIRIRHRAALARGEIVRLDAGELEIALDEPVLAIAPGQSLVLYDGARVLGGGFIESASHSFAGAPQQRASLPVLAA
jgi:tRNA-specific 2-thiouridylase